MTVQELIDKLNTIDDKSMPIGVTCEYCETWRYEDIIAYVDKPEMHSAGADNLDDCEMYSDELGQCMCEVPLMMMIAG